MQTSATWPRHMQIYIYVHVYLNTSMNANTFLYTNQCIAGESSMAETYVYLYVYMYVHIHVYTCIIHTNPHHVQTHSMREHNGRDTCIYIDIYVHTLIHPYIITYTLICMYKYRREQHDRVANT